MSGGYPTGADADEMLKGAWPSFNEDQFAATAANTLPVTVSQGSAIPPSQALNQSHEEDQR